MIRGKYMSYVSVFDYIFHSGEAEKIYEFVFFFYKEDSCRSLKNLLWLFSLYSDLFVLIVGFFQWF
uniref:Putative ovule protein n=1 Tax=Solanum chacoense TaxID=4108 RepID=A0A0V0HFJ3_SOLCH